MEEKVEHRVIKDQKPERVQISERVSPYCLFLGR